MELSSGIPVLNANRRIMELAESLVREGPIPRKVFSDPAHIEGVAAYCTANFTVAEKVYWPPDPARIPTG